MDNGDQRDRVVDYASPDVQSQPKSLEGYYRELPSIATWTIWDFVIWVVSFLVLLALVLWVFGTWWGAAWS